VPDTDRFRLSDRSPRFRPRPQVRSLWGCLLFFPAILACLLVPIQAGAATEQDWIVTAKLKFLFGSHTSYEFGNPYSPYQVPLSRLEFPLNTIWAGFEVRRNLGRLSAGFEYLASLADQETDHFRDSDWDDDADPSRLSIFGETQCRVRPSFQLRADVDLQIADLVGLPEGFILRPLVGYRWQHLAFMAHDGTQYVYGSAGEVLSSEWLPGNTISFQQDWCALFGGLRLGYTWNRASWPHRLTVLGQADMGPVWGYNLDRHLLRGGDRATREYTQGLAWHTSLGLELGLTEHLSLGVEGDYLGMETTGVHKLTFYDLGFRFSNGVRAWSQQSSISVKLTYGF
jgi:hypothetical protein